MYSPVLSMQLPILPHAPQLLRHCLALLVHLERSPVVPRLVVAAPGIVRRHGYPVAVPQLLRYHFALLVHLERPRILPCGVVAVSKAAPHHCRMLAVPHLLRHRLVLIMHLERPSVVNGVQSLVDRQQPKVCWKRQEEQHLLLLLRISDLFRSPRPQ